MLDLRLVNRQAGGGENCGYYPSSYVNGVYVVNSGIYEHGICQGILYDSYCNNRIRKIVSNGTQLRTLQIKSI